jgi:hypothetical protein
MNTEDLKSKAINRIDKIISQSNMSYDVLMTHLRYKIKEWIVEKSTLTMSKPFELSNDDFDRKIYLVHMIEYSEELVDKYNRMDKSNLLAVERDRKLNKILV